ncbi:MAG: rhodanese-like domain-containing protein [Rhodobacteraceae bacterium]|nr:rhodanese-like domain-containing protein [Paracoccaceae bacterium]
MFSAASALILLASPSFAQDVWITPDTPFVELELNDEFLVIERNPDNDAVVPAAFAKTSRACPPFCIQPLEVADGVETIGELELIAFLENEAQSGTGLLIDARTPNFFLAGTIPGSINLPFNLLNADESNPFIEPILAQLGGVKQSNGTWTYENAVSLALFCNGPWCGQSPRAIRNLLSVGYPADKLKYYRGGMQSWLMLGLSVVVPES